MKQKLKIQVILNRLIYKFDNNWLINVFFVENVSGELSYEVQEESKEISEQKSGSKIRRG